MSNIRVVIVVLLLVVFSPLGGLAFIEYEKGKCASFVFRGVIKTFCSQHPLDPFEEELLGKTLKNLARRNETPDKSQVEISRSPEPPEVHIRFFDGADGTIYYASGSGEDFRSALKNITVLPLPNE